MLNQFQLNLFNAAEACITPSGSFYKTYVTHNNQLYVIYNYRLVSYSEFLKPGALELRGLMFQLDPETREPIKLAAMPMHKFFNLNENPMTMNVDLSTINQIFDKLDGSLISSYIDSSGELQLKSKGSLTSEQAVDSLAWLKTNPELYQRVHRFTTYGFTVNMEWCSPTNRIVLGYAQPSLRVLNVRNTGDGTYMDRDKVVAIFGRANCVTRLDVDWTTQQRMEYIQSLPASLDDIEGVVFTTTDGLWVKVKTQKYLSLHSTKDSITNPRKLFWAVLDQASDDLLSMFAHDPVAVSLIQAMQTKVFEIHNHICALTNTFHAANKHLSRKDYAILAQQEKAYNLPMLGLLMSMYTSKTQTCDVTEFLRSRYKELGIKDQYLEE